MMKKKLLITGILTLTLTGCYNLYAQVNLYLQTPTPTSVYISWHSTDTSFTKDRYGLSAGIYSVQMKCDSFVQTRKMALAKKRSVKDLSKKGG